MIQDWWQKISQRERHVITFGGIFLLVVFVIYGLWLPLVNDNKLLHQKINHQKALVDWMEPAVESLRQPKHKQLISSDNRIPLAGIIETQLLDSPLAKAPRQLTGISAKKIQIDFERVAFDTLITWLSHCASIGISVEKFTVEKSTEPGFVMAHVVLYIK